MDITNYDNLPDLLTPADAAAYLQMSREYIYKAIYRGDIDARKLGNKIRIPKRALKKILEESGN